MQKNENYYDAAYFNEQRAVGQRSGKRLSKIFSQYIKETDIVLDFGCGGGYLLNNINCDKKLGFDINQSALNNAKTFGIECYQDLELIRDKSLDVIISNSCLEHVPNPLISILTLKDKLKKGGVIILSLPHETIDYLYKKDDWNYHLYTWSPMAIGNLLNEAGFKKIKVESLKGVQAPLANLFKNKYWDFFIDLMSKPYRILRLIASELGIKGLAIDGNSLAVGVVNK